MHPEYSSYAERAALKLSPELLAYVAGGAETETTLRRNRHALDTTALIPRLLEDVSAIDTTAGVLGMRLSLPVLLAPVGSLHLLHADGLDGAAAAAHRHGVCFAAGCVVRGASEWVVPPGTTAVYQLYVEGDDDWVLEQCRVAEQRGFSGVAITADAPVFPVRRRDIHAGNHAADRSKAGTSLYRKCFTWRSFERIARELPELRLILKGVQDPDDAQRAYDAGASAVYVSNHGGRQLDHGQGAIDLVAPVARVLKGRLPLIVDGGFTSGLDVLKALVAGADLVGIGRSYLYPYAAGGGDLLSQYLSELDSELRTAMALVGASSIAQLKSIKTGKAQAVGKGNAQDGW